MPDPEFARISYRGQNTETARVVVPEVSKQSNLADLVLIYPGFAYKKAPYQTRRLFFFFATDAHLSVETGHKISAAPARQSSPLLAWIVPENDLIGQWLLNLALEALTGKTCASASSRELARAADMGNLCQKSLGSAGRVSFFSTSLMTHLWTDLAVIYSCHSRLHFIDLAFLHAL